MNRIEIDVTTGEYKSIELTPSEIAEAQIRYQDWLANQPTKEEQIAKLKEHIDGLLKNIDNLNND